MSKPKIPIYIDMDEVICDFLTKLCSEYNNKYNKDLKPSDIKSYNLLPYIGEEGIELLKQPGFFSDLKPIEDTWEIIFRLLAEGEDIFIISSPMNEYSVFEKYQWVQKYLSFFPIKNLILVGNKGELLERLDRNGILFDDCPLYIEKFGGITVVMDRAYNQGIECDFRISSWEEFYEVVKEILK